MERNYQITAPAYVHPHELHWRTAFHEAGHAAAIHIRNQQKQLPPVFFEIQVKRPTLKEQDFFAKVIDGNLIQNLPIAVIESISLLSDECQHSSQRAYEADVVNLLVGPLAEAKYVSIRDGEVFNLELINLSALRHYGGHSDLEKAQQYLEFFITSKLHRDNKLVELLAQAYQFVSNHKNWACILNLAHFILDSQQETISCDEAITIFDRCLSPNQPRWPGKPAFLELH
ncbi:hypothetical protein A1359_00580 [Methylomonas lenta]|uniref:Peptidase M41 domain-containing protein n=1 Tax=Methylomonas lenta TaxID=980561 RepID=A0A177NEE1_9GAMM|nr:hypothetical protein [Methylomonas lenta]OAI15420.1 hypothetical protein A1359_00580 [Methylomonas lenta]